MNTIFDSYQPEKGEITKRFTGSLIAYEDGEATSYGIFNSQDRGPMFVEPAMKAHAGMLVGICSKGDDIVVNVLQKKSTSPPSAPPARTRRCGCVPPIRFSLGGGHRVHRRRRADRGHAEKHPPAQAHP